MAVMSEMERRNNHPLSCHRVQETVVRTFKSGLFYCLVETVVEKEEVRYGCAKILAWRDRFCTGIIIV